MLRFGCETAFDEKYEAVVKLIVGKNMALGAICLPFLTI